MDIYNYKKDSLGRSLVPQEDIYKLSKDEKGLWTKEEVDKNKYLPDTYVNKLKLTLNSFVFTEGLSFIIV